MVDKLLASIFHERSHSAFGCTSEVLAARVSMGVGAIRAVNSDVFFVSMIPAI
jgi:hypothetical protein